MGTSRQLIDHRGAARFAMLLCAALCAALGSASCGTSDACADVAGTCLAVDLALDPTLDPAVASAVVSATSPGGSVQLILSGLTFQLSGLAGLSGAGGGSASGYTDRQVVSGEVRLPASVGLPLPALTGPLRVQVQGPAQAGAHELYAGAANATVSAGEHTAVAMTLRRPSDSGAACDPACLLGCDAVTRKCRALRPTNLPAETQALYPDPLPPAIDIAGTVYLDTAACAFDDGLNPALVGQYRGTLVDQGQGPTLCVIGVSSLRVLSGGKLVIYSSQESASTRPAVLLARTEVRVLGTVDARACRRSLTAQRDPSFAAGPGGYWGAHGAVFGEVDTCAGQGGDNTAGQRPGGGGGGHATAGGVGGSPTADSPGGRGGLAGGTAALQPLRGGCGGGCVKLPAAGQGEGGGGGGAVQISAGEIVQVDGLIDVSGCGAVGGAASAGGCGGGAGGAILLEAPVVKGRGTLAASGGGGAAPGTSGAVGGPAGGGAGGKSAGASSISAGRGAGAPGEGGITPAEPGQDGGRGAQQGAGGGGGLGRVRINAAQATDLRAVVVAVSSSGAPQAQ